MSAIGTSTRLGGANLAGANIGGANFYRALYDPTTIFPEGFDAAAHAMIMQECPIPR